MVYRGFFHTYCVTHTHMHRHHLRAWQQQTVVCVWNVPCRRVNFDDLVNFFTALGVCDRAYVIAPIWREFAIISIAHNKLMGSGLWLCTSTYVLNYICFFIIIIEHQQPHQQHRNEIKSFVRLLRFWCRLFLINEHIVTELNEPDFRSRWTWT